MPKKGATGLFAQAVAPVTARPSEGAFEAEMADWVRQRKRIDLVRQLERGDGQVNGAPAGVPQVATVQDQIALSKEAREAARDVAELARQQADEERERRQEAEERAGSAFQSGQQEAESRWSAVLGIVQETNKTVLQLIQDKHATELKALQEAHAEVLKRIDEKLNAALAAKDVEVARHRERAEQLEQQVKALSERETFDQVLAKAVLGQAPKEVDLIRRLFGAGQSGELAPEQEANRRWMIGQVEKRLSAMDAEERRKDALHGELVGIASAVKQALASLNLGTLIPVPRRPDSAVPEWAEEVPPEAQEEAQ